MSFRPKTDFAWKTLLHRLIQLNQFKPKIKILNKNVLELIKKWRIDLKKKTL